MSKQKNDLIQDRLIKWVDAHFAAGFVGEHTNLMSDAAARIESLEAAMTTFCDRVESTPKANASDLLEILNQTHREFYELLGREIKG